MPDTPDIHIRTTRLTETPTGVIAEIVIADSDDLEVAHETISFRVAVNCMGWWGLAAIQRAALQHIRDVIGDEIQRTGDILNQRPD